MNTNQTTQAIIDFLNSHNFVAWRNNTTGIWDPQKQIFRKSKAKKGISDIIGYQKRTGIIIAIEIKTGSDKLSFEQYQFLKEIRQNNGFALVTKSFDHFFDQFRFQNKDKLENYLPLKLKNQLT